MNKPQGASPSRLFTPDEAIRYLALDKQRLVAPRESLRWLCRSKKLRFAKIGRYVRFRQEWLDEFIDRAANKALFGNAFHLPTQIQDLAPDKVTSEMRQQIQQAIAALRKVQTIAGENAKHLRDSLKQGANVIDVNCVTVVQVPAPTPPVRSLSDNK